MTSTQFTPGFGIPGLITPGDPGVITTPPTPPPAVSISFIPGICSPVVHPIDDGLNLVSNVVQIEWEVDARVSPQVGIAWKIKQSGVTSTIQVAWNTHVRLEVFPSVNVSGLSKPVVYPIDSRNYLPPIAWQLDGRTSSSVKTSWKIFDRKNSNKKITWNVLNRLDLFKQTSWKVYKRIYIPGVSNEEYNTGIDQPVVHPISFTPVTPSQNISWHLNERISLRRSIHWNTLDKESVQQRSTFNTLCLLVSPTVASSWMTHGFVSDKGRITWNLAQRKPVSKRTTWNTITRTSASKSIHWKLLNGVTVRKAIKWNLISNIDPKLKVSWNLYSRVRSTQASSWSTRQQVVVRGWRFVANSPGNICTSVVHPIDVGTPGIRRIPNQGLCVSVVYPIDYSSYGGYGFSPVPQSSWRVGIDPSGRVSSTVATTWNLYNKVTKVSAIKWNLVGRTGSQLESRYNVLRSVTVKSPQVAWILGSAIGEHIRQTVIDRLDFAY